MRFSLYLILIATTMVIADESSPAVDAPGTHLATESFNAADVDHNLKISAEEFTSYYKGENAAKVFRNLDRDGDSFLSRQEFISMQDFSILDFDLDRKITLQEFTSYYRGDDGAQIFSKLDKNNGLGYSYTQKSAAQLVNDKLA